MHIISSALPVLPVVLKSWTSANSLVEYKAQEDTARTGYNLLLTVFSQIQQTHSLHTQFYKLLEIRGKTHNYTLGVCFALAVPPLIAFAEYKLPFFRKAIHPLHNSLGSLCQIAGVITSLAILRLGHVAYAVTSLTILSLGYLQRRHYLPLFFRRAHDALDFYIGDITKLLYGSWLDRCFTVPYLFEKVYRFFQKRQLSYDQASHASHLGNFQQFDDIFTGKTKVEVNREHIWIDPFPHVTTTDFSLLQTFGDNFKWNIEQLKVSLKKDARWKGFKLANRITAETDTDAIKIEYAKMQLKTLITNVQNKQIQTGGILDYTYMHKYLGFITENLPSASLDLQQQILIQLAIEGGDYCGPGIAYQLEVAATALLQASENGKEGLRLPLKRRILLILQQERLKTIESFHPLRLSRSVDIAGRGEADPHGMNYTIQLMGSNFGLPDQGADQDKTARESFVSRKFMSWLIEIYPEQLWTGISKTPGPECERYSVEWISDTVKTKIGLPIWRNFPEIQGTPEKKYEGYSVQRICDAVKSQIGIPLIPNVDVCGWACEWIKKDRVLEEEFNKKFGYGEYMTETNKFKENFIKAMLVDMGILQICGSSG